jgi:cytochrome c oxidase subunit II
MEGSLWLPPQASTLAPAIDWLFNYVTWVSFVIFVGVMLATAYLLYKYRRREADEVPTPPEESKALEIAWVVIPTILVLTLFTWGFKTFVRVGVAPPDAYEIRVRGYQWAWDYYYPDGSNTTNEFYVPVGRPIRMLMDSQDVLHSFFVPAFRVKHDVLPNRYTSVWFEATQEGVFDVFCTEYCGTSHSYMLGKVHVVSQDEFNELAERAFQADMSGMTPEQRGEVLYRSKACNTCHSVDGSAATGPTWKGLFGAQRPTSAGTVVADENYLREAILAPGAKIVQGYQNVMPANYSTLKPEDLDGLIAYIKTLQ